MSAFVVLNSGDSGAGSLRQAILDANAHNGADEIRFNIQGAGTHSIALTTPLPAVTDTLNINGASQPGYAKSPLIEINGHGMLGTGIAIEAGNCRVQGLVIGGFAGYGILLTGLGKNVIQGNWIGTDSSGLLANGNRTGGILVSPACNGNVIGVDGDGRGDAQEGNVISSNGSWTPSLRVALGGIRIEQSHQNVIAGNLIGTDKTGGGALLNSRAGIVVLQGSQGNRIGTDGNGKSDPLERNVIAGRLRGIELADFGTNRTVIAGNNIGVDVTGTKALGSGDGIWVGIGVDFTRIGTDANGRGDLAERNIISGSTGTGIWLEGTNTTIAGNLIGTDVTGTLAIPNGTAIGDTGGSNLIGGTKTAARNVISGNYQGVLASGADCQIQGNFIGTDMTGTKQLANSSYGISAAYSTNLHVGGRIAGARNIISGNDWGGVELAYSTGSVVEGNYIGTDVTGKLTLGNGIVDYGFYGYGVAVDGDGTATIGGNTAAARNLISGNVYGGVSITGWANGTIVSGNYIGTDVTGTKAIPNHGPGIYDAGLNSQIGGTAASAGNLISGNSIGIYANGVTVTLILSNRIGTDASGKKPLGNTAEGVLLDAGAIGVVVGTPVNGNTIAFNGGAGVAVADATTNRNTIRGNSIFSNGKLGIDLGNDGVTLPGTPPASPNGGIAFPRLTQAIAGNSTRIIGSFQGVANATILIDVYVSLVADPSGYGEGQRYLGTITVTTNASGAATFDVVIPAKSTKGSFVTATATDAEGNTSEFGLAKTTA